MKKSLNKFTEDFIVSQRGQWDYPGLPTAVPTPTGKITTKGVKDDLIGIDNLGNSQYMTPNNEYQFEGDMVYEIPQVKKGGSKKPSKKLSRSLMAKNILFTKNQLFKKAKSVKNKIFDPNSPYFKEGGAFEIELDDAEIDEYRRGGYIVEELDAYGPGGEPCPDGFEYVDGNCVEKSSLENCEDGRCEETDQIQKILDEGSYIPKKNVNIMWDVVDANQGYRTDYAGDFNQDPRNARNIWTKKGAQALSKRMGMYGPNITNVGNCMWSAGMGYQCLPETKGKIPLMPFESNDKFINAVNKGTVPFSRVTKTHDPNFASQETGMLQQGDVVNFKGGHNSHAMTFSHYREDGMPIFLNSNGSESNFDWDIMWPQLVPNKEKVAYVSRFNPEKFYEKDIKALEEKARNNPTMIEKQFGGLHKFVGGGASYQCPTGEYWNGTKCVKIPKNTRIVYHTDKDVYDKAFAAESDSSHFYNNAKSDFNKINKLRDLLYTRLTGYSDRAYWNYDEEKQRQEKKWHTDNYEPGTTINHKYKGPKSNLKIKPVSLEINSDGYAFPKFKKPVVHNVYEEPIKEEEIDLRLPPLKPGLLPQQNYELQGTYEEDQVPEYSPSYPENRIGYDKYNWYTTKSGLPKRQKNTGGFYDKMSKKVEDIKNYMEGYEDEEGNYIPGEIKNAEREGRQLNFQGNFSKADKEAQEAYTQEYDEYENLKNYQNQIMNLMQYKLNKKQFGGTIAGTEGLTDNFSQRLSQFILDARTQGIDLNVGSGYRSYEKQKKLWEQALKKYGSPEKARKWVAPPGSSNHNKGLAVDLSSNGLFLGKDKNVKATEWAHANAKKYGLNFRMGWEPWHIEPLEKGNSKDDGKTADDHDHSSEFGNDETTKKEKLDLAIKNKELEFENKKLLLAEQEKIKNDDDYSNWTPRKKIEDVDPTKALLENYSKIINPSLQNINNIYTSNLQGQMKRGGIIMDLDDDEIETYKKNGYVVENYNENNFQDGGNVSKTWELITGTPWADAKNKGYTTGSYDDNIALLKKLNSGELNVPKNLSEKVSTTDPLPIKVKPTNPTLIKNIKTASSFNDAFTIARKELGTNQIFEYNGRKYGTNLKGETFNPSKEVLEASGMNTPQVKTRLEKENKDLTSPFLSKSTVKLQPDLYEDWEKVKKKNTEINKQKNADKIINYKQKTKDDKNFLIVDKQKGLLHVYDSKGTQLYSSAIDLGAKNSDAQTVTKYKDLNNDGKISGSEINKYNVDWTGGNVSTGAGKFYISNIDKKGHEGLPILNMMNESQYENFLKTGKVENVSTSFHKGYVKDDNSRVSNGCVRCDKTTLDNLTKYLENASEVYILPEDKGNEFVYENGKLNFKVNSGKDYNTYIDQAGKTQKGQGINRTQNSLQYYPIKIKLNEEEFKKNKFTYLDLDDESELKNVKSYVKALEENKQKIMKLAKINGDVYNEVAKVSFGILGNESNFADTHDADGNAFRAINKYFNPKAASPDYYSKYYTYRAREDNRSAGLTQLRWSYLNADEKEILKKLNINSNKDFLEPTKAAIGTTAILAIRYNQQLDANEKKNILNNLPKTWGGSSSDNYKTYTNNVIKNSKYLNIVQSSQPNSFSKTKYSNPTTINVNKDGTKTVKYVDPKTNKTHINVTTKDGKSYYKNYSKGGFIMDLDDDEIKKYIDGGYVVKEIN